MDYLSETRKDGAVVTRLGPSRFLVVTGTLKCKVDRLVRP